MCVCVYVCVYVCVCVNCCQMSVITHAHARPPSGYPGPCVRVCVYVCVFHDVCTESPSLFQLETLCREFVENSSPAHRNTPSSSIITQPHVPARESTNRAQSKNRRIPQDPPTCKTEPVDSTDLERTLRAVKECLHTDSDLVSSLLSDSSSFLSDVMAKLKEGAADKENAPDKAQRRNRKRKAPPRRKAPSSAKSKGAKPKEKTTTSGAKSSAAKSKKVSAKPDTADSVSLSPVLSSRRIKKEPVDYTEAFEDFEDVQAGEAAFDDSDNDPDFNGDVEETQEKEEGETEAKKRRVRGKKKERKERRRKRGEGGANRTRMRTFDVLKQKLETLGPEELEQLGIRRLGEAELTTGASSVSHSVCSVRCVISGQFLGRGRCLMRRVQVNGAGFVHDGKGGVG